MKRTKDNMPSASYGKYLVGLGVGTLLAPALLSALGTTAPSNTQWKVWLIGVGVMIIGLYLDKYSKT